MLKQIDHIGIAVKNLEEIINIYRSAFGLEPDFEETVTDQQVRIAGYRLGESVIEYFSPIEENSSVNKFLEKRGNAIHHVAFRVKNIEEKLQELIQAGFNPIDRKPRLGADGKKIAFLHPEDFNGILIELCEP
jgi:methylmalonyl-CoA/ethylmalonyl-CoA epimerase